MTISKLSAPHFATHSVSHSGMSLAMVEICYLPATAALICENLDAEGVRHDR